MRKFLFASLLMICAFSALGAESVEVRTDVDLSMSGTTSTGTLVVTSERSGVSPTTEADPHEVYIPVLNTSGGDNSIYYLNNRSSVPTIFSKGVLADAVKFPLRINTSGTNLYLYAAAKDNAGAYKIIKKYSDATPAVSIPQNTINGDFLFPVGPASACLPILSIANCAFLDPASATEVEVEVMVYFFLSANNALNVNDPAPALTSPPESAGAHFKVFMSNKTYTDTELRITVNKVRIGDKRLTLEYTASSGISATYKKNLRIFSHAPSSSAVNLPIGTGTYVGTLLPQEYTYSQNGEVTVTNLVNGQSAELSVLFVDKFLFATTLSEKKEGTPLEIQELLKKQACFLLTAGFGEEHFIIDYFRHFRDEVLSQNVVGRAFIDVYYEYAPKYALMIYQNEPIRAGIRGIAYILYFTFKYFLLLVLLGGLVSAIYFFKNKEKIKI